jgi:hypothetical protein
MYFLMAMIVISIYHMDPPCITFMVMDINYIFIIHGSAMYFIDFHAYIMLKQGNA